MDKLIIDREKCIGCGLCSIVCIRKSIEMVDSKPVEVHDPNYICFDCGHCRSVCPRDAIRLTRFSTLEREWKPCKKRISVRYEDLLQMLSERRSIRWFTSDPVSDDDYRRLFDAARFSPTENNKMDVRFVVIRRDFTRFMEHLARILAPVAGEHQRVADFVKYMNEPLSENANPFTWHGTNIILAFSEIPANAFIAMARIELAACTIGLGGFYSKWITLADTVDHEGMMGFFPEIPKDLHLESAFVIGHPGVRFLRTAPRPEPDVTMR